MTRTMLRTPWLLNMCLYRSNPFISLPDTVTSRAYSVKEVIGSSATLLKATDSRSNSNTRRSSRSTVDAADVARHTKLMSEWWDPNGPMKGLHAYNLVRIPFIRSNLCQEDEHKGEKSMHPLRSLTILDVGCGGGILSEPLVVLGADVTGIDASPELIQLAQDHADLNPKIRFDLNKPTYICTTIEEHASCNANRYDAVVASEVIEHVYDKELFVSSCVQALKPGGWIFFTTPNRTKAAELLVIKIAENIFKVVPKGTHQIEKFITPDELEALLQRNGCHTEVIEGLFYNVFTNKWSFCDPKNLVYALGAVKNW